MCGIAGILSSSPHGGTVAAVARATRALNHRGPDDEGFWSDVVPTRRISAEELVDPATVVLGHRRLSIVDVVGGAQPMSNESATVWVSFNGEIYNQRELREELAHAGHRFATRADTEVLVHGWEEWGERLFERLNGIFAFALVDSRRREVVLARDPLGVKPLYVGAAGATTWWSSELGAAKRAGFPFGAVSAEALKLFLLFRFIPSPYTGFEGVWKLPPGHFVRITRETAGRSPRFLAFATRVRSSAEPRTPSEWREALIDELNKAVERQVMSDVPVASLLSGGVDSSLVTMMMAEALPYAPQTFGIGFPSEGSANEAESARRAAEDLRVPHRSVHVSDDEYVAAWPDVVREVGEPIANSAALLVRLLCAEVGKTHKVVLCGQGADEQLGGYPRHVAERVYRVGRFAPRLAACAARLLIGHEEGARLQRVLSTPTRIDRYVEIFSMLPFDDVDELVRGTAVSARELGRAAVGRWATGEDSDSLNEVLRIDSRMSLADDLLITCDHAAMRSSVELRVPFLDLAFIELVERMPSRLKLSRLGERKWLYRQAAGLRLPSQLSRRVCGPTARIGGKRGFATPLADWFAREDGLLADAPHWFAPLYDAPELAPAALDRFQSSGSARNVRQRNSLFTLSMWLDSLGESRPGIPHGASMPVQL